MIGYKNKNPIVDKLKKKNKRTRSKESRVVSSNLSIGRSLSSGSSQTEKMSGTSQANKFTSNKEICTKK